MIPKECKRLAEVDFPIAVVSKHAAREKSIRHGHPSTLHLWWARRPLAACRAMLLGLLLPDPCDENCPEDFKRAARELLPKVQGQVGPNDKDLRKSLLRFVGDFANWDLSADRTYREVSQLLVKSAHPEETPLIVDPFAGGGAIPLEALRLGCETFASDLNPVACLILKVLLEDIPRFGPELADKLRRVGAETKKAAEKELAEFYPHDPDGAKPIAYLWARTVKCEQPGCGAEIPLVRSFWLCKKSNRRRALKFHVKKGKPPQIELGIFEPKNDKDGLSGTVARAKASCPACNMILSPERVRAQLVAQRGGADVIFDDNGSRIGGARLLTTVTLKLGEEGRLYRLPTERDYQAVWNATQRLRNFEKYKLPDGLSAVPDEPLPPIGTLGFRVQRYGMLQWGDLFTARQKLALVTLAKAIQDTSCDADLKNLLALVVDRVSSRSSSLCLWRYHADQEKVEHIFGRQALPIVWDFAEAMVMSESTGSFQDGIDVVAQCIQSVAARFDVSGQAQLSDACKSPLPDEIANIWFTDPPYYDAVPYADLSDFFFVWLKRTLLGHPFLGDPFDPDNPLTPKINEVVQDEVKQVDGHPKDKLFFERSMARAFAEGRRVLDNDGIGCVVFAHKTTEGWEALLSGMINVGWVITGSWPITTEMANRLRARESAALSASVHLVCRPRSQNAPVCDWGEVLRELPKRVGDWMERLQSEGIRGADLVFACIGPALEIFSRCSKVETAEGREVSLSEYLEKVWEVIGRVALKQILGTDTPNDFGEDARLTALFLWTVRASNGQSDLHTQMSRVDEEDSQDFEDKDEDADQQQKSSLKTKGSYTLPYDIVRRFSQPLGIHLERWKGRLIDIDKGLVRLLPVTERTEQLLGHATAQDVRAAETPRRLSRQQLALFGDLDKIRTERERLISAKQRLEQTTWSHLHKDTIPLLDHVHQAMLFQKQGETTALRELLFYEQAYRPEFVRLANALSALYPKESEEKRLLDALLLTMPK